MEIVQVVELVFILLFVLLSGFFSGSETALMSVSKVKVRHDTQKGVEAAKSVDKLLKTPSQLLTTILVGNNVVNIAGSALATTLALELFGANGPWVATIGMTLLVLIFGEITPKTYATQNSEKLAYASAPYLLVLSKIFKPLIKVLIVITNFGIKMLGGDPDQQKPFITEDEIMRFVNVGKEEGVIEEEEKEMIHSIFAFDDTIVREVMVPRIDIFALEVTTSLEAVLDLIIENGHSRIPIYQKSIDNIIGVLYAKDLLKFIFQSSKDLSIRELLRPAYFVPESKKVNQLLSELKGSKVHMAIILDEYGGTAGIATIEDLLEEIVGDIQDEYDFEEVDYYYLNDNELIVDARMPVDELNDLLNISLPEDKFDTLGGLVLNILGHIPKEGEVLEYGLIKIVINKMLNHRIVKLQVILTTTKTDKTE